MHPTQVPSCCQEVVLLSLSRGTNHADVALVRHHDQHPTHGRCKLYLMFPSGPHVTVSSLTRNPLGMCVCVQIFTRNK